MSHLHHIFVIARLMNNQINLQNCQNNPDLTAKNLFNDYHLISPVATSPIIRSMNKSFFSCLGCKQEDDSILWHDFYRQKNLVTLTLSSQNYVASFPISQEMIAEAGATLHSS